MKSTSTIFLGFFMVAILALSCFTAEAITLDILIAIKSKQDVKAVIDIMVKKSDEFKEAEEAEEQLSQVYSRVDALESSLMSIYSWMSGIEGRLSNLEQKVSLLHTLIREYAKVNELQYNAIDAHQKVILSLKMQIMRLENLKDSNLKTIELLKNFGGNNQDQINELLEENARADEAIRILNSKINEHYNRIYELQREKDSYTAKIFSIYDQLIGLNPVGGYFDSYGNYRSFTSISGDLSNVFKVTRIYSKIGDSIAPVNGKLIVEGIDIKDEGETHRLQFYIWTPYDGERPASFKITRNGGVFIAEIKVPNVYPCTAQLKIERVVSGETITVPFIIVEPQIGFQLPDNINSGEEFTVNGYVTIQKPVYVELKHDNKVLMSFDVEPSEDGVFSFKVPGLEAGIYGLTVKVSADPIDAYHPPLTAEKTVKFTVNGGVEAKIEVVGVGVNVNPAATINSPVKITALVSNIGGKTDTKTIIFKVDGKFAGAVTVTIKPGETRQCSIFYYPKTLGQHVVEVEGKTVSFNVVSSSNYAGLIINEAFQKVLENITGEGND